MTQINNSKKNRRQSGAGNLLKSKRKKRLSGRQLTDTCEQLLGIEISAIEFPGGKSRRSCRLRLADGRSVIVTQRPARRAAIENHTLSELNRAGAPVPQLLAVHERLLIQEDINGERLSQRLNGASDEQTESLLDSALSSLAETHQAGSAAGLDEQAIRLGDSDEWLHGLLRRPAVIGRHFDCRAPRPQLDELFELLQISQPRFIKWDARPGNAMVRDDHRTIWFDWEHCGARNRLDDMAWLLGDEFVPDYEAVETRLLDRYLDKFSDKLSLTDARTYLYAYGVFHMTVRLGLILDNKGDGEWWDLNYCIEGDKVGITLASARRTCRRAARWAARTPLTEPLAPWFEQIEQCLPVS